MRILVVGPPAPETSALIRDLERYGHQVTPVHTGAAALAHCGAADFVLLDLDLPGHDSLELCAGLRSAGDHGAADHGTGALPVIALSGGGSELDRVLGLRAGADDCIDKPYEMRELAARMAAVTRRRKPRRRTGPGLGTGPSTGLGTGVGVGTGARSTVAVGDLHIDPTARKVRVQERPVPLTRKEFDLLYYLARHPEMVVTRQRLLADIWQIPAVRDLGAQAGRTVDTHVSSLRAKLGQSDWIVTVRGVGFRLAVG